MIKSCSTALYHKHWQLQLLTDIKYEMNFAICWKVASHGKIFRPQHQRRNLDYFPWLRHAVDFLSFVAMISMASLQKPALQTSCLITFTQLSEASLDPWTSWTSRFHSMLNSRGSSTRKTTKSGKPILLWPQKRHKDHREVSTEYCPQQNLLKNSKWKEGIDA